MRGLSHPIFMGLTTEYCDLVSSRGIGKLPFGACRIVNLLVVLVSVFQAGNDKKEMQKLLQIEIQIAMQRIAQLQADGEKAAVVLE